MATATIAPALRALMEGLIDYAGLFPPAKLPLEEAVAKFAAYRAGADAWMLGRFIIQASRLKELDAHRARFTARLPLDVSALGRGGATADEFLHNLQLDAVDIHRFVESWDPRASVRVIELRLPEEVLQRGEAGAVGRVVQAATSALRALPAGAEVSSFFEAGAPGTLAETLEPVVHGIREGATGSGGVLAGFKLRCGGVEASAFPGVEDVARAITVCRDAGVPLKCTAGLHHPVRHYNEGVGTHMHGFLNVFGGALLARGRRLSWREVAAIIECERAADFGFGEAFSWRGESVGADEVRRIRRGEVISFGSCSFDEPREDLASLGLLPS